VQPAEWSPHAACWLAWPSHEDLWQENLAPAREAFVAMCRAVAAGGGGERIELLVPDDAQEALARAALAGLDVRFHRIPFGDIWLRDTAPVFVRHPASGEVAAVRFGFNGWGGKYVLDHDDAVSERVAAAAGFRTFAEGWVLEGGSIDVDGEGTCLTTRQCLLHPNRNPTMNEASITRALADGLGLERIVWLGDGLVNDHTDGHVDNVARFCAPGAAVCMEARSDDDPNRAALDAIAQTLAESTDAKGRRLEVVRIPSPGRVTDDDGRVIPASFVNFYIGNRAVVVPVYGTRWDDEAVERIGRLFPGRRAVGVDARGILSGGGAFHCISQQQPA
jgi:agmatine deiminase